MIHFGSFRGRQSADMHTNGMAAAGGSNSIGSSASPESFERRREVDRTRQYVSGFNHARVAHGYRDIIRSGQLARESSSPSSSSPAGSRPGVAHDIPHSNHPRRGAVSRDTPHHQLQRPQSDCRSSTPSSPSSPNTPTKHRFDPYG